MINLFAHRGYCEPNISQNSIKSLRNSYDFGFRAIEFDIWFMEKEILLLVHDQPNQEDFNNLPKLRDFFSFKDEFCYWLDFKNLDEENCYDAFILVKKEVEKANINQKNIYLAPYITNYEVSSKVLKSAREVFGDSINYIAVCDSLEKFHSLKDFLAKDKVRNLSIFHKLINQDLKNELFDIELFAWTVNDLDRLSELESLGVKNFATDKITPQNYENHKKGKA